MLLLAACDSIGNPPSPKGTTTPITIENGGVQLTTQAHTAPRGELRALLREQPYTPQYLDRAAPPDGVFSMVVVSLRGAIGFLPQVLPLETTFTFHDRDPIVRRWIAAGNSREVAALFGLPRPPRSASTALAR